MRASSRASVPSSTRPDHVSAVRPLPPLAMANACRPRSGCRDRGVRARRRARARDLHRGRLEPRRRTASPRPASRGPAAAEPRRDATSDGRTRCVPTSAQSCANMCSCRTRRRSSTRTRTRSSLPSSNGTTCGCAVGPSSSESASCSQRATRRRRTASARRWAAGARGGSARTRSSSRRACRRTPRRARPCSRSSRTRRRSSRGSRSTRRSSTCAGCERLAGHADGDRRAAAPRGARRGRAPDHGRGSRGRSSSRRWRARVAKPDGLLRRAARRRARLPASAAGRAAVGRRPRSRPRSCTSAGSRRSGRSPRSTRRARRSPRTRVGPAPARARAQPRPAAACKRVGAVAPSARSGRWGARPTSLRGDRLVSHRDRRPHLAAAPRGRARCRTVVLRLRFDDFTRATRSLTMPRLTDQSEAILTAARDPLRRRDAARSSSGGSPSSASR